MASSITDNGVLNTGNESITWPAARQDMEYLYGFSSGSFSGTVDLTVKYSPIIFTVMFIDPDITQTAIQVADTGKVKPIADPIKPGYVFTGWSETASANELFNFNQSIVDNHTLYACYTLNVKSAKDLPVIKITKIVHKVKSTKLTVYWQKQAWAEKYQVRYRQVGVGHKWKTVNVASSKAKLTIHKLKPGKKYYVQVRYKTTVDGVTMNSLWSKRWVR